MLYDLVDTILVYPSAMCNLKCSYCYVTKTDKLKEIDDVLAKSFEDDYYINFIREVLTDANMNNIKTLELWGAEPTLHLDRTFNLIEELIKASEQFYQIRFSTNLTTDCFEDQMSKLIALLSKYKTRDFVISMQVSIDGPAHITDSTRGEGVTKRILDNWEWYYANKYFLGNCMNVRFNITTKGTFSTVDSASKVFLSYKDTLDYYKFFEDMYDIPINKNGIDLRINLEPFTIPNFAEPYSFTVQDGVLLADICYNIGKYKSTILKNLNHYREIMLLKRPLPPNAKAEIENIYAIPSRLCGSIIYKLGFLPNKKFSGCVRIFSDFIEVTEYKNTNLLNFKKSEKNAILLDSKNECDKLSEAIHLLTNSSMCTKYCNPIAINCANMIRYLAKIGLVNKKYLDSEYEIKKATYLILNMLSPMCVANNMSITGSLLGTYAGEAKLFLNGAVDAIYEEEGI